MKGILFKAWKADAIRTMGPDRAWQTRRALKPQPEVGDEPRYDGVCAVLQGDWYKQTTGPHAGDVSYVAWYWRPKYKVSETVYVKERYDAAVWPSFPPWKSPMFMPASAARTLLLITSVRVQRTRDISKDDCLAEGIWEWPDWWKYGTLERQEALSEQECYFRLYDSINGAGAHEKNWDWVYEFRLVKGVTP